MKHLLLTSAMAVLFLVTCAGAALATPTKQIWIPSTDTQDFATVRFDLYNRFRVSGSKNTGFPGQRDPNFFDIGVTVGVLPFEKLRMEAGFDFLTMANDPNDQHPWSGNLKLATPEDALFSFSPALAVGIYHARPVKDVATEDAPLVYSGQNLIYGLLAKTLPEMGALPSLGRLSAGYYVGSRRALKGTRGQTENTGLLLSWDRTMSEVSDKLWLGVDYQGGDNVDGSLNFGVAWAFNSHIKLLAGYDIYTRNSLAGSNTLTAQVSISVP